MVKKQDWLAGWWSYASQRVESPNCNERPAGCIPDMVVIHAISLPPKSFGSSDIQDFFTNQLQVDRHPFFLTIQSLKVSAHFLIRRDGGVVQFVSCDQRAWHAGQSSWSGRSQCNDFSIGIELEGGDNDPFESAQYVALVTLCQSLVSQYPIRDIVGHSDIAPDRKTDPGPFFEWERLKEVGGRLFPLKHLSEETEQQA